MSQARDTRGALQYEKQTPLVAQASTVLDPIFVTARGQLDIGELDLEQVLALTLAKAIAAGREEVEVDLEHLDSIDPEDVGLLVRARSFLQARRKYIVVRSRYPYAEVLAACALLDPHARVEYSDPDGGDAPVASPSAGALSNLLSPEYPAI